MPLRGVLPMTLCRVPPRGAVDTHVDPLLMDNRPIRLCLASEHFKTRYSVGILVDTEPLLSMVSDERYSRGEFVELDTSGIVYDEQSGYVRTSHGGYKRYGNRQGPVRTCFKICGKDFET